MTVTVRERTAKPAQTHDVGMPGGRTKHDRVAASDGKPEAVIRWQAVELRVMQGEMAAFLCDCLAAEEPCNRGHELGQALGSLTRTGPDLADVSPLTGRVTRADA
jgi:hypothetical protein